MENGADLEQLGEAELCQQLDAAGSYEERSRVRAALRHLRKSSSSVEAVELAEKPAASPPQPRPAATYRRPGYQVQKDPPLHYGVRHWENVSVVPALARRLSQSQSEKGTSRSSSSSSAAPENTTTTPAMGEPEAEERKSSIGLAPEASESRATPQQEQGAASDSAFGEEAEKRADEADGAESGYRSESRMSSTSFRSEGGESQASLDSVQSDLELEEVLQKQIESSQDYDDRKKLRARLRQVQQRRMSKCQMSTVPDSRPESALGVTGAESSSSSSSAAAKPEEQPSWVKLARGMCNPAMAAERRRSTADDKVSGGDGKATEDAFKSVALRKTGRLERKVSSAQETERPAAATAAVAQPESPYKSVQLRKTGALDGGAAASVARARKTSVTQAEDTTGIYKGVELNKTGSLERSGSGARRTSVDQSSTNPPDSPYKGVQLKKTGVLEQSGSVTGRESTASSSATQVSPYKSVQLKKTGTLERGRSGSVTRRDSVGSADGQAATSPYKSVQLKTTGTLERGRSGSVTRRDSSVSSAGTQAATSPYKSVQLKKTGVLEAEAAPARRASVSRTQSDSSDLLYKSSSLRKTNRLDQEQAKRQSSISASDAPMDRTADFGEARGTSDKLETPSTPGSRGNGSQADEPGSRPDSCRKSSVSSSGPSPWNVALRKVNAPAKTPLSRRDSTPSTGSVGAASAAGVVDYLSVLRAKRRATTEADGGGAASPQTQSSSSRSESPGADYLSVLRRRKASEDPEDPVGGGGSQLSARRATPQKAADTPDYRAVLRGSLKKTDSQALDNMGRPKVGASQPVDYLSVLNKPQSQRAESPDNARPLADATASTTSGGAGNGLTNGHDREPEKSPYDIDYDIILPGGIHITSNSADV